MAKKITLFGSLIIFLFSLVSAQIQEANQDYIKAITTPNQVQQYKLLKEWLSKYAGKGSQYESFVYAQLCLLDLKVVKEKSVKETIEFGEKAIQIGGLDDLTFVRIYITVSEGYRTLGNNLEKAHQYVAQAIKLSHKNTKQTPEDQSAAQWKSLLGVSLYVQGKIFEKEKKHKDALDPLIQSYNILKDKQIITDLTKVGKVLYEYKYYTEAEQAFKMACQVLNDYANCVFYANTLYRNKKKDDSLKYYEKAYMMKKTGEIAYIIGVQYAKKAEKNTAYIDKAIKTLLEASFLSPKKSKQAMKMAEHLFFNSKKDLNYNENIKEIILTEVKLKLVGGTEPVIKISSKDMRKTFADDISGIGLDSGELTYAHFRFILDIDGKQQKVSFMIAPPDVSDLSQKKYVEIISDYLKAQGVKLI